LAGRTRDVLPRTPEFGVVCPAKDASFDTRRGIVASTSTPRCSIQATHLLAADDLRLAARERDLIYAYLLKCLLCRCLIDIHNCPSPYIPFPLSLLLALVLVLLITPLPPPCRTRRTRRREEIRQLTIVTTRTNHAQQYIAIPTSASCPLSICLSVYILYIPARYLVYSCCFMNDLGNGDREGGEVN